MPKTSLTIVNPKRDTRARSGRSGWYPYYAGFSLDFAHEVLKSAHLPKAARVLDLWNGSGTTTSAAHELGRHCVGIDLNPVMVIVAKARLLPVTESPTAITIANEACQQVSHSRIDDTSTDPLCHWLDAQTAGQIRAIERVLYRLTISTAPHPGLIDATLCNKMSLLSSFLYLGLFRTVRTLLDAFTTSNPTWLKKGLPGSVLPQVSAEQLRFMFLGQVASMAAIDLGQIGQPTKTTSKAEVFTASSTSLPLMGKSIDFVLTSPPYCTRIDYAVATNPELAILGYQPNTDGMTLRRSLIGTSTVPASVSALEDNWGSNCIRFLNAVQTHSSKASATYYFKNHVQYYASLAASLSEMARVLKSNGRAAIVVQDSHYKEIHNDVPISVVEMCENRGLQLFSRVDFDASRNMARIHPGTRRYRKKAAATESVLCFEKIGD